MKKFIFFVIDDQGRSGQIVNGVVVWLSTPKALAQAPDGNQEISIGWERSMVYFSNVRTFSLDLGAVMDMATILKNEWYKNNIDIVRYLLLKRLTYENTLTTFKEYYKQYYKGKIDFSSIEDDKGGFRVNFRLLDGGLQQLLKAHETTQYDIPLDIDAKNIYMDGLPIRTQGLYFINNGGENNGLDFDMRNHFVGIQLLENSDSTPKMSFIGVQRSQFLGTNSDLVNDPNWFFEASVDATLELEWDFKIGAVIVGGVIDPSGRTSIQIQVLRNGVISPVESIFFGILSGTGDVLQGQATINVLKGDKVFFRTFFTIIGPTGDEIIRYTYYIDDPAVTSTLKAKSFFQLGDTTIRAFTMYDLGRKLIEKITGNADNFESVLLQTKNILYTSMDAVRGLPNSVLKTSWKDYWQEVTVRCMAEMHITETKIIIEERQQAFDSTKIPVPLGEVKNFKVFDAIDLLATSIKFGNAEQQTDDANGKFDPMGWMIFNTPIKAIPDKQLDLQSPYKASPYEIEQTRANYEGKTSTDKSTDNDIVAIAALPSGNDNVDTTASFFADGAPFTPGSPLLGIVAPSPQILPGMKIKVTDSVSNNGDYTVKSSTPWFFGQLIVTNEPLVDEFNVVIHIEILEGQQYGLDRTIPVTQLTDPDIEQFVKDKLFNVPLSPKRILVTHYPWLSGMMYLYGAASLTFSSANRNKEMIAGGLVEKADVDINYLGPAMFIPKYFEFDIISPVNLPEIHANDNAPYYSFIWDGVEYFGFAMRDGIAPNDLEEQTFKLLASPVNNMLTLI